MTPPDPEFLIPAAQADADPRPTLACLFGADYSARALTPQRSDTAPDVVRRALARFAPFDSRSGFAASGGVDLGGGWCVADHANAGAIRSSTWDAAFERIHAHARSVLEQARFTIALGGDHSVSWPIVTAVADAVRQQHGPSGRLGVLQLDVHHDVRPLDDGPSNGTPFRGLLEAGTIHPDDLVQVGIHPFANRRALVEYCDEQRIRRFPLAEVAELGARETGLAAVRALSGTDAIWLSVDIDVLDRAHAPGTAAALPGALDPATLLEIVETACSDPRVIGMDVVEFDPERDVADITSYAVANVVMAALSAVARRDGAPT
ncbi:MAG: arginase family protein [Thermoleophilia bacterium]|nr:arginase family protein [Thermoleophilia bacterium]